MTHEYLEPGAGHANRMDCETAAPKEEVCPVCESGRSTLHARIDGFDYFHCRNCGSLHIDRATIDRIDGGQGIRVYDQNYWAEELKSAQERATGESLVRVGEALLYVRRPVRNFLDVGTGPGYLLDALVARFPTHQTMFHGVEMFPPGEHSQHPNYLIGNLDDVRGRFDAGVCIEVVEHLTPGMLKNLARGLACVSAPNSLWLFNTGMPELVLGPDPGYLDPLRRGHIVSYGLPGLAHIFEPFGFRIRQVPSKNHAWFAEFRCDGDEPSFEQRVLHPLAENERLLKECALMYQAAFESGRASLYLSQMLERSAWALGLERELNAARALHESLQAEHHNVAQWAHSLHGELTALQAEHAQILNSRSWRLTQPLRTLTGLLQDRRTRQ